MDAGRGKGKPRGFRVFTLSGEKGSAREAVAEKVDDDGNAEDVVELGWNVGFGDLEAIQEGDRRTGLQEVEPVDFKDQVGALFTKIALGNGALAKIGAGVREVRLDPLAGESVGNGGHHLLGKRVAGEPAAVAGDEGRILKFVRPGAQQAVAETQKGPPRSLAEAQGRGAVWRGKNQLPLTS